MGLSGGVGDWRRRMLLAVGGCLPLAVLAPSVPGAPVSAPDPTLVLASGSSGSADGEDPESPGEAPRPRTRTVTLALTGDVLIHDNVWASARRSAVGRGFDFRPMLAGLRPRLDAADLALCHLETPLAPESGPFSGYPLFSAPPAIVPALSWLGYDGCSTASNHSVDQGYAGVARTLDDLDAAGLSHTGTARTPAEDRRTVWLRSHGMTIAWLAATYGTNGMPVEKPWSVDLIDVDRIVAEARAARRSGADAVIVALHWGDEYSHAPSAFQLDVAERLTRAGQIDLVYGHHAHVVQPIRRVNRTWVVFGLGNLLAGQGTTAEGVNDGLLVEVTLSQRGLPGDWGPVRVRPPRAFPTHIDASGPDGEFHVYDVARALSGTLDSTTRAELLASRRSTLAVLRGG